MNRKNPDDVVPGVRAAAKQERHSHILDCAVKLYCAQGIEATSMEQVSSAAAIGSATIYRYFPTKTDLVLAAALHVWEEKSAQFVPMFATQSYQSACGREQLSSILDLFLVLYGQSADFLRFLQAFDSYIAGSCLNMNLSDYEALLTDLKQYAVAALKKGQTDGSLHFTESADEVYFTIFHAMLSTTQKLALQGELLSMDAAVSGKTQIMLLKKLLIAGLSTQNPLPGAAQKGRLP